MRDGLNATGRAIFFALCGWHDWYAPPMPSLNYTGMLPSLPRCMMCMLTAALPPAGGFSLGNSARIASDDNSWAGVLSASDVMARLAAYARPGYWNDPDLLLSVDISGAARLASWRA